MDTWVWILLAIVFGMIGIGFWWSGRGLTTEDRERRDQELKNSGGDPSGWLM